MKITTILLLACTLVLATSCSRNCEEQLKKENARLQLQLDEAFKKLQTDTIPIAQAEGWAKKFRDKTDTLLVPLSWRFDANKMKALASRSDYIRFYSVVDVNSNTLKIVAVGVDNKNNDILMIDSDGDGNLESNVYNFAETCPGTNFCPTIPSVLYNTNFKQEHGFVRYKK